MTDNTLPSRSHRLESDSSRKKRGVAIFIRDLLIIFVVALLISFLIKTFLVRSFYIPSGSMENTLMIKDRILVDELTPRFGQYSRGDVVVFRDPGGWLPPQAPLEQNPIVAALDWTMAVVGLSAPDSNDHLIKRIIGLPGDHVVCCNTLGQMSVNDIPLSEPYALLPPGQSSVSKDAFDVTVPENSLWVMGDNRYDSLDSRYHPNAPGKGFVPMDNVVGRALVISWPLDRWSWLGDYPEVFRGVEDAEE